MTKDEMVNGLRYKAANIKAHMEPQFFAEIADYLEEQNADAISREDALMCMTGKYTADLEYKPDDIISQHIKRIKALPSVTPQRPKGKWVLIQRDKKIDICCSNCKAIRVKEYAYNYTVDQLDKEYVKETFKSDDMRYCPYCGTEMESEE